ncbi:MAG: TlpA family protein disulfide reductase [Labilithrix sp.]|nr:TlpA family protein disulfide reductase [Labilithrix sp.]
MATATSRSDAAHTARMLFVVLALAAGFALVPRMTRGCGTASGTEVAPDFTADLIFNAPSADQKQLTLSALRGQPVILEFWASWCQVCHSAAPIINGVAQRFKDRGLVVVGIDTSDERILGERTAAKKGLAFPIVYDKGNAIARDYHVDALPTIIVLSKEGKIVAVRHGLTSESDLDRLVKQVL